MAAPRRSASGASGGDGRVEQVEPGLPGVHLAPLVAGQRPHRGVTLAARLEDQADPARVGRRGQRVGDHVLLAPPGHGAVQREAQAVDQRALAGPGRPGQGEEVHVGEVGLGRLAVAAEPVEEQPQRSHQASPVMARAGGRWSPRRAARRTSRSAAGRRRSARSGSRRTAAAGCGRPGSPGPRCGRRAWGRCASSSITSRVFGSFSRTRSPRPARPGSARITRR